MKRCYVQIVSSKIVIRVRNYFYLFLFGGGGGGGHARALLLRTRAAANTRVATIWVGRCGN